MGNYRFRLSDMMPNAWFYKLKDMSRAKNHQATTTTSAASAAAATTKSVKKKQTKASAMTNPKQLQQSSHLYPRKSYYFTRELGESDKFYNSPSKTKSTDTPFPVEPPRKSSKQRRLRRRPPTRSGPKHVSSSVSAGCSCRATIWTNKAADADDADADYDNDNDDDDSPPPGYLSGSSPEPGAHANHCVVVSESRSDRALVPDSFDHLVAWSNSCSDTKDIVIDVDNKPKFSSINKFDFDSLSELELPPIITKPVKKETNEPTKYKKTSTEFQETNGHGSLSVKVVKEEKISTASTKQQQQQHRTSPVKRSSVNSPGVRLRLNSPKIASRKIQGRRSTSSSSSSSSRRSNLSDSFAVVKSSFDPQRDFRDSMVEMIVENNIRASKDLEDLLACYLSLNSDEYHELIIKVFKQIWFDLTEVRLKQ